MEEENCREVKKKMRRMNRRGGEVGTRTRELRWMDEYKDEGIWRGGAL
jgi:hypothetical protein